MSRIAFAVALLLGVAAMPNLAVAQSPAPAKPAKIKLDTLKPGKLKLDSRLGYILVRIGPRKTPTDHPMPVAFIRIDEKTGTFFTFDKPEDTPADFWRTAAVAVNTSRSFGDSQGSGVYLVGAYPGRWVIGNVGTTCLSMGTYAFDVKQGEITDIGTLLTAREDGQSPAPELKGASLSADLASFGVMMNIVMSNALFARPASDVPALPAELQGMPRHHDELEPDFRFANTCTDLVNRAASLPPIGHQPPMTADEAVAAIAKINPAWRLEAKKKREESAAAKAALAAKAKS